MWATAFTAVAVNSADRDIGSTATSWIVLVVSPLECRAPIRASAVEVTVPVDRAPGMVTAPVALVNTAPSVPTHGSGRYAVRPDTTIVPTLRVLPNP